MTASASAIFSAGDKLKKITEKLKSQGSFVLNAKGLAGSSASFLIAEAFKDNAQDQLIIAPEREQAAYILNDLENLLGKDKVLFFPRSYKKPYADEFIDNANVLLRAEVLSKVSAQKNPLCIVSYPEALAEKVLTKAQLNARTFEVGKKEKVTLDFIVDTLYELGFNREEFVFEPGQLSIRGGIVDIFSFASEYPFRLELNDEEVESIRTFDPTTQLSIEELESARIIPNIQTELVVEERQPIYDFIGQDTLLWTLETEMIADVIQNEFESAMNVYAELDTELKRAKPAELYLDKESFLLGIKALKLIELGSKPAFAAEEEIIFNIQPQPSFNKKFDLLLKDLISKKAEGYRSYIYSRNPDQIERIENILTDISNVDENSSSLELFIPKHIAIHEGFVDNEQKIACYTDHQLFERYHRFELKSTFNVKNKESLTLKELKGLNPGDYITHIDHGIGRFGGLEKMEVGGKVQETIRLVYKDNDILFIPIHALHRIAKYSGKEGGAPRIDKLGSNKWSNFKKKTIKKVKEIAYDLIKLYAKRRKQKGFAYTPDTYLQNELEASFIYEDTPDQKKATVDVKRDMEADFPMDRLVCGDVGFGKTEIAIRAAFKAVTDGKQVAVLVPTTILALQHYKTFKSRLKELPCTIDYLNRFRSSKEQKDILARLQEGKIDIIIGTHKLVGKSVKFKDLGMLVIDEEQKFGVSVKDKLKLLKENVDTLTLTATPIPRTLQFSLMGARDLSIINTPPPNRYPVQTELSVYNEELIRDAITYELQRGGQAFLVHNRVQSIEEVANVVKVLCPDVRVKVAHGQMDGEKLEQIMLEFIEGDFDVLVCTAIIESGLDIPNANTIIINNAQLFGLSDLHQLRGRVGRSNKKAFCYLLTPPLSALTQDARKRLKAVEEFSDLGSGFQIAMRDLDIRGAGNLLGAEQSGFITEIGYEMYQKILDEALEELKQEMSAEDQDLAEGNVSAKEASSFVKDCAIETDMELLIPDTYVNSTAERISLYKMLDESKSVDELQEFKLMLRDRFGEVPEQTLELVETIKLRFLGVKAGFEKLVLKNERMYGYFIANQDSPFYKSLAFTRAITYVQSNPAYCKLKESKNKLIIVFDKVRSINEAIDRLTSLLNEN